MELESKRLKMQEVTESDVEQIYRLHSSPEVDEYNTLGIPENMEVTERLVRPMIEAQATKDRKSYDWKIIRNDSGEFIGLAGISLSANRFKLGEIYYELFPSH
jgi:RimJ/RimL family protein N-acetyltransferase